MSPPCTGGGMPARRASPACAARAMAAARARGHVPTLEVRAVRPQRRRPLRQARARDGRRPRHRDGAHPSRARGALQRVRQLAGGVRARVRVLRDRSPRPRAQPRGVGDRRAGAPAPRDARRGRARPRRRVPGDGRAARQRRARHRGDPRHERSLRARDRRARDHGVHVGPPERHPAARARGAQGAPRAFRSGARGRRCGGGSCRSTPRTRSTTSSPRSRSTRGRPASRRCGR